MDLSLSLHWLSLHWRIGLQQFDALGVFDDRDHGVAYKDPDIFVSRIMKFLQSL